MSSSSQAFKCLFDKQRIPKKLFSVMVVGVGWRVRAAITGPVGRDCLIVQVIQMVLQQLDIRKRLSPQLPLCWGHKLIDFILPLNIFPCSLEGPHQLCQIISKETSEEDLVQRFLPCHNPILIDLSPFIEKKTRNPTWVYFLPFLEVAFSLQR